MRDIVQVQEGNEKPFIERAIALKYDEITLIYTRKPRNEVSDSRILLKTGLIEKKGFGENISLGTSLTNISKGTTMLVNNEFDQEKDFVHQRRSGLNHVWIKECKKQNITVLFNFSKLQKQPLERVSVVMGRMMQNAKLCKKYGVNFELVSFTDSIISMRHSKDVAAMKRLFN